MTTSISIPRLVLVTNRHSALMPLPELAVRAIAGGVDLVQIREKDLPEDELRGLVRSVLDAVADPRKLTVNGSPAVAREFGIGLHLPESAAHSPGLQRKDIGLLSRSIHSEESARVCSDVDFLIAGHIFPTGSKPGLPPLGLKRLAEIVAASPVPVIAIGGVTKDRVARVMAAGAFGVAVISAINDAADPEAASREMRQALEHAMTGQSETVTVAVNGKEVILPAGVTVLDYLKERGHHDRLVVVELNGRILSKSSFSTTTLSAGDRVEIVHFVGGG